MTNPKLEKDMEKAIQGLKGYFEEKKAGVQTELDKKSKEIKADAMAKIRKLPAKK
jgi:hypothetical protein